MPALSRTLKRYSEILKPPIGAVDSIRLASMTGVPMTSHCLAPSGPKLPRVTSPIFAPIRTRIWKSALKIWKIKLLKNRVRKLEQRIEPEPRSIMKVIWDSDNMSDAEKAELEAFKKSDQNVFLIKVKWV